MAKKVKIESFILGEIPKHTSDIVTYTAKSLSISRQTAHYHLKKLINEGEVIVTGEKKGVKYFLNKAKQISFSLSVGMDIQEDRVFDRYLKNKIGDFKGNVRAILNYGFTKIFNNVLEHSNAKNVKVDFEVLNGNIIIEVSDNGLGAFKRIQDALHLDDPREAILEMSKGKFTTDPNKHTGEGIFFSSRIFDRFELKANNYIYTRLGEEDYFLESCKSKKGTSVKMILEMKSTKRIEDLFKKYSDDETFEFSKTEVMVSLVKNSDNDWISRSQARRLLFGLDKFSEVVLDFKRVKRVGQAFVDEVFRVFKNKYPNIKIKYKNANQDVVFMIKRGISDS